MIRLDPLLLDVKVPYLFERMAKLKKPLFGESGKTFTLCRSVAKDRRFD